MPAVAFLDALRLQIVDRHFYGFKLTAVLLAVHIVEDDFLLLQVTRHYLCALESSLAVRIDGVPFVSLMRFGSFLS